ncbi:hypothetical protein DL95DRAFT_322113 [Leptodontidium sp. 2 PMI_412]|nr:hypothetical protein DL95DRAFT_322113 [Leptodontidium sp. 2 PMI_412]
MAFECPTCKNNYSDILDHIRKKHPTDTYTTLQLQPIGLTPCPTCATACKGAHGVKTHSAKIHGITGNSKISTQHRIHTAPPASASSIPLDPEIAFLQLLAPFRASAPTTRAPLGLSEHQYPNPPALTYAQITAISPISSVPSAPLGFKPPTPPSPTGLYQPKATTPTGLQHPIALAYTPQAATYAQALASGPPPPVIQRTTPTWKPTASKRQARTPSPGAERPTRRQRKAAIKLLEKGYISRASRALIDPTLLAPDTPETLNTLYDKHPIGNENPFGNANPTPGQHITEEAVLQAIKSINKEKAAGLSGWTRPLLNIALYTPKSPVLTALTHLANMIRQGTAPGYDLLCASRLIGLQKPNGGVRPIAIGDLIYKVALKAILITSFRSSILLPNQLGVNSVGGVKPAIFLLEEAISGPNRLNTQRIASLDLTNAYNRMGRTSIASAVAKYAPTLYRAAK